MNNLSACLLLLVALASWQTASAVKDCYYYDAAADFEPWADYDLSKVECEAVADGRPGTCVHNSVCFTNDQGENVRTNPQEFCRSALGNSESALCCGIKRNCTATPALSSGSGTSSVAGACVHPTYCSNAVATPASAASCESDGAKGLACCADQDFASATVSCSRRFSRIFERITRLNYEWRCANDDGDSEMCFTNERLTNFLPFALKTFDNLRDPARCLPSGDCSAASYIAFFYHMLVDFTRLTPEDVLDEVLRAVPPSANSAITDALKARSGHMTPDAFAEMLDIMWTDPSLDLLQYNAGTCADWIRMADATRGPNHTWKCDARWKALLAGQYCRPKTQSNLKDCASGAGICFISGEPSGVCASAGLTELSTSSAECQSSYGAKAFCCAKTESTDTEMTFSYNQYNDVRIVIDPDVEQNPALLQQIKDTWTKASSMLYVATEKRAVLGSVTIMLPDSWNPSLADAPKIGTTAGAEFVIKPDLDLSDNGMLFKVVTITTQQLGYCGSQGLGTTMSIKDIYGNLAAPNIVKHFAFNRFGIYREFPRSEFETRPIDALRDPPPRCVQDNSTAYIYCNETMDVIVESDSTVTGSIAWLPDYTDYWNFDHIVHFCDGRECDQNRNHNKKIDNTHNRVCNKKATFDVILGHQDFDGSGTPPRNGLATVPEFKVVHRDFTAAGRQARDSSAARKIRAVLVLDTSGSMEGLRLDNEKAGAYHFVDLADENMEIGVVSYGSYAQVISEFTAGDASGKSALKNRIRDMATTGLTCIDRGLSAARQLLQETGERGGHIVLATDGSNSCGDYMHELPEMLAQGVTIHTVAITNEADQDMHNLALGTGGKSFLIPDAGDMTAFVREMQSLFIQFSKDQSIERVQLETKSVSVAGHGTVDVPIVLDEGLGDSTIISAIYNADMYSEMAGTLSAPSGATSACTDEPRFGKLNCQLTTKPEVGTWQLRLHSPAPASVSRPVTVTASATVNTKTTSTISVQGSIIKPEVSLDEPEDFWEKQKQTDLDKSQALMASVSFGRLAVIGAQAQAIITHEDGTTWTQLLSDNGEAYELGQGADLYSSDGNYGSIFQGFGSKLGRYSVRLEVTGEIGSAFYTREVLLGIPISPQYLAATADFRHYVSFTRSLSLGTFTVTKTTPSRQTQPKLSSRDAIDAQVPAKPGPLEIFFEDVTQTDVTYTFSFSTVGQVGVGEGHPSYYLLNVSTNALEVESRSEEIEVAQAVDGRLVESKKILGDSSQSAGQKILYDVQLPLSTWLPGTTVYCSVTAYNIKDMATLEAIAGPYSNVLVLTIPEPVDEDVCGSDGIGNCNTGSSSAIVHSPRTDL